MHTKRNWIRNMLAGLIIGIGCVLPGVSGGVMAVSFGLYRPMLDAVLHFFQNTRAKVRFLLPIAIGGAAGVLLGARGLSALMARHGALMLFLFIGFIAGGLPSLWSQACQGGALRLPAALAGILLALPLAFLGGQEQAVSVLTPLRALLTGLIEGVGTVVPGISTSFVLIRLGWYEAYLAAMSSLALPVLLLIGAGFITSALFCMKAVQWLFDHASAHAYSAVLGFVLVSILLVFPGFDPGWMLWADLAAIVIGVTTARFLDSSSFKGVKE